jgi:hypothetical protein
MSQAVEHLPSRHRALSLNHSTIKKKKKKTRIRRRHCYKLQKGIVSIEIIIKNELQAKKGRG